MMHSVKTGLLHITFVAVYFLAFIASNIGDVQKYLATELRWLPRSSEGPLLYQVSATNPSRFSKDREELLLLYFLTNKVVFTNLTTGDAMLAHYYRINCKLNRSGSGNVTYQGYHYVCRNLHLNSSVEEAGIRDCKSREDMLTYENIAICSHGLREFENIFLYKTDEQYFLLPIGTNHDP